MLSRYYLVKVGKRKYKRVFVKTFLKAKCIIALVVAMVLIEPIFIASSDLTYKHREKTKQEIVLEQKEKNPLIYCFMDNESDFKIGAFNPKDGDGTPRCGVLQFKWETYVQQCVYKYGLPYVERKVFYSKKLCGEWDDVKSQVLCATKMIEAGLVKQWGWRTRQNCSHYINQLAKI